jgi:hypothetical protein
MFPIRLNFQDAIGMLLIRFPAGTHLEYFAFVDYELTIVAKSDLKTVQRPRRRTFKIQSGFKKSAAVARALEFGFCGKPPRRAAEMSAFGEDRVNSSVFSNNPYALILLVFFADFADGIVRRRACFESRRWLEQHTRKRGTKKT